MDLESEINFKHIDPLIKLQKKVSKNYYIFELFSTYRTFISKTRN